MLIQQQFYSLQRISAPSVQGQTTIHLKGHMHFETSINASLPPSSVHSLPVNAFPGQLSTHSLQSPHLGSIIGKSSATTGALVKTEHKQTAQPYCSDTSKLFLPINPSPVSLAIAFCGNELIPCSISGLT